MWVHHQSVTTGNEELNGSAFSRPQSAIILPAAQAKTSGIILNYSFSFVPHIEPYWQVLLTGSKLYSLSLNRVNLAPSLNFYYIPVQTTTASCPDLRSSLLPGISALKRAVMLPHSRPAAALTANLPDQSPSHPPCWTHTGLFSVSGTCHSFLSLGLYTNLTGMFFRQIFAFPTPSCPFKMFILVLSLWRGLL